MADPCWLHADDLRTQLSGRTVFVDLGSTREDAVSLRLRSEIAQWLGLSLVSSAQDASVVLRITGEQQKSRGQESQGSEASKQLDNGSRFSSSLSREGYAIDVDHSATVISSPTHVGLLYGFYAWLRDVGTRNEHSHTDQPDQSIRMVNQWDQTDGSVERGYAGESLFFGRWGSNVHSEFVNFPERTEADVFRGDMDRITEYARLLSSTGINAISLNNVNVRGYATRLIVDPFLSRIAQIARIFSSFGIATFLSVNFASPKIIGHCASADPCDDAVIDWWKGVIDHIYERIPDFGGFLVKADSEGEPGPYQYGRTHAEGANMFARLLKPHHGIVIWRAFVYNSHTDWRDRHTDRAKAAFDNFFQLDGKFSDNAVLQVKFGPIDFQPSEPLHPLIARLKHTNLLIEFEITAEYLGHQIDVNYSLPQWIGAANTDTGDGPARERIRVFNKCPAFTGFAAVSNVGMDENWTGNALAQINLYAYGRFCWDATATPESIAQEWTALTFPSSSAHTRELIENIQLRSNTTYENYAAPLGVGFMVNRDGHYDPGPDDYEFSRWGTYHFADRLGVGVDRTVATGTGYAGQYPAAIAARLEDPHTTPENMLLFFHHLPYTYRLQSGQTFIQHIYDTHFEGVEAVREFIHQWDEIHGDIDETTWKNVADRLGRQLSNAREWCDEINTFFYRLSGDEDEKGRRIYR